MSTRKQILDQDNNVVLPITDTEAVRNPQSVGGTLEDRLQNIESREVTLPEGSLFGGVIDTSTVLIPDISKYYIPSEIGEYTIFNVEVIESNFVPIIHYNNGWVVGEMPIPSTSCVFDNTHGLYGGVVRPNDEPIYGNDYRYWYLAFEEGTYTYFNNRVVSGAINLFSYKNKVWTQLPLWPNGDYLASRFSLMVLKPGEFTNGNLPQFNSSGDLIDSGKNISDFATSQQGAKADTAYQKPQSGIPYTDLSSEVQELLKDATNSVSDSINAFVDKMNEYAVNFGMARTHFLNASGQNQTGHYSTAKDIMRMCACCTAYEKLMRFWGLKNFTFHVAGTYARDISVVSSYKGSAMESVGDYYHIYGGMSGTWNVGGSVGTVRNLTLVVKSKVDAEWLVGCVIKTSDIDRGIAFKQLMDWLEAYRRDPTTQQPTINAAYAAAGVVQPHNQMAYIDVDYCLVAKSGDVQYLPAAMTKLMTAMVVLDYCSLDETLTIITSDIQSGSGPTFYNGDKISIADAIPAMLLPSSDTLAVALSRFVGNKIINIKNK